MNKGSGFILLAALVLAGCGSGSNGAAGPAGPAGAGITWVDVTGDTVQAVANTGYMADSVSRVTVTLPATLQKGDIVQVSGVGTGGWKIAQNPGQTVIANNLPGSAGAVWTAQESARSWYSVASSSDGTKLVAVVYGGQIYTSTDSGATWTARESTRSWSSVASSSDGNKLVAGVWPGQIYTSSDYGVSWTALGPAGAWQSVASSADGNKLVAVAYSGQIYTSVDSGLTWTARDSARLWWSVASSSDGTKLVAVDYLGHIFTSTPNTTIGSGGSISGGQYDAIALQYIGNNTFTVLSHEGNLVLQ